MDTTYLKSLIDAIVSNIITFSSSPAFYAQLGLAAFSILLSYILAATFKKHIPMLRTAPAEGAFFEIKNGIYQARIFLFPLFTILALTLAADLSTSLLGQSWAVRAFESLALIFIIYTFISRFVKNAFFRELVKWTFIPIAILQVFGLLDGIIVYLESIDIEIGNIKVSAYGAARVIVFGVILFWIGRVSNTTGQKIIRKQESLDISTREIFAKLFQAAIFLTIFLLLLQVMGINLTALAVFGGALGVGLGFGLQSIASNFISGIILLLDRSLSVGDYIELSDGKKGTIREMNMRSTLLETFDGKDIMVPNEQFITSTFTNWTHQNKKQRYSIEFQVSYNTDLHPFFDLIRKVVASHPRVLSGADRPIEELPDAEISGFGDSGVNILVEFWMEGIDDGENRVGADLLLMIWDAIKEHGIEIPFPQREVKILRPGLDRTSDSY